MANGRASARSMCLVILLSYTFALSDLKFQFIVSIESSQLNLFQGISIACRSTYYSLQMLQPSKSTFTCSGHDVVTRFTERGSFFRTRICRYAITDYTFQLGRLIISGDICTNPGHSTKPSCEGCSRTIARNHRSLMCTTCDGIYHIKCGDLKPKEFTHIQKTF